MDLISVSVSQATEKLPELINQLVGSREPVVIEKEDKVVAVLITYEQLEYFLALKEKEELFDQYIIKSERQLASMQNEIVGLQTQNRRIQEYLFGQKKPNQ
ncbi:hypothetical protein BCD67_09095 [Oscillatoriales cyanobacterium USR001]|nr:hypothetical protein BCD67_09095 [Oscillatoriales cyanobacterium USR001]